jgi:hypothetical protein
MTETLIDTREEWNALPPLTLVRLEYVTRKGEEEIYHVIRSTGTGGASAGNVLIASSDHWDQQWITYRESHHVLACRVIVLYTPTPTGEPR